MTEELKVDGYGGAFKGTASSLEGHTKNSSEAVSQDIDGIFTATAVYTGNYYKVANAMKRQDKHPEFKDLKRTNYGVQRLDGTLGRATGTFKGVFKNETYVRYNITANTVSNPIQTHPFFKEGKKIPDGKETVYGEDAYGYKFGGKIVGGAPDGSNQAFFEYQNNNDVFKCFPKESNFDLPGVTQYLGIGMALKCTVVSHFKGTNPFEEKIESKLDQGGYAFYVGQVVDPPDKIKPDVDAAIKQAGGIAKRYNWLLTNCAIDIVGSAIRQNLTFTLSGYKGWNKLIYNKPSTRGSIGSDNRYD